MKIKSLIATTALLMFLSGCSRDLLDEKPPQIISTESLYTTLAGFDAGLGGLYATLREERECVTDIELRAGMFFGGTDNLTSNYKSSYGFNLISQLWGNANNPLDSFYSDTFAWLYSVINAANTIINQAETRTDVNWAGGGKTPEENKNRILAEAKALRAWAYRHLTFGWGDVPLSLKESLGSNIKTDWERTPVATVRKQIISDFLFAEKYTEVQPAMRLRITKGAVQHYLAEMYLTIRKPDSALYWANQVVNNPAYKLITQRYGVRKSKPGVPFMDMFYEGNENRDQGNTEALWVWQYSLKTPGGGANFTRRYYTSRFSDWVFNGTRALVDTYERGGRGRSRQAMTKWAIDLYEPQDDRATNYAIRKYFILNDATANAPYPADKLPKNYKYGDTLKLSWSNDISTSNSQLPNWPFSRKCEGADPDNVGGSEQYNDLIYIRLAETYLLKAEAEYRLGKLTDAATSLNTVRRRSKASDITEANVNLDFILDERSRELVMEENRRWTLIRTGKWLERVKLYNKNGGQLTTARDTIFPIPQVVIDANLTNPMSQNPGY